MAIHLIKPNFPQAIHRIMARSGLVKGAQVTLSEVMEKIYGTFPIFNGGVGHVYEVVDRRLDPVRWNPEGIKKEYLEFLYGEHGLRTNIATYLTKEIPSIDPYLKESLCDFATEEIENRFSAAFIEARFSEIVKQNFMEIHT